MPHQVRARSLIWLIVRPSCKVPLAAILPSKVTLSEDAIDLAAFRLSMIAPVKKSVNHSRIVASMRETG